MANLTGEYDVVVETSADLINRVLAVVHENQDSNFPRLLHSLSLRVDDTYQGSDDPLPESQRTGVKTRAEIQVSTPSVSFPVDVIGPVVFGSRERSRARGRLAPRLPSLGDLAFPEPSLGRIRIRLDLRAWVRDAPQPALPEFVHGSLSVTAGLERMELGEAGTFVGVDLRSDLQVIFEPAPGTTLSDDERTRLQQIVRNVLQTGVEPVSFKVDPPPDVRRLDLKVCAGGPRQSVMALFVLGSTIPSPRAPDGVTERFLSTGTDVALAVGRVFLAARLRAQLLRGLPGEFSFSGGGWNPIRAKVRPDWDNATVDLEPGRIVLSVAGTGSISYTYGPLADDFNFTVRIPIGLRLAAGAVEPFAAGDPEVNVTGEAFGGGFIEDKARSAIKTERDRVLQRAKADIGEALDVRKPLEDILGAITPSAPGVAPTAVHIRPEGVIVTATVALAPSRPVVVRHRSKDGLLDALASWIPGGTIDRFVWQQGIAGPSRVEEHRFVTDELTSHISAGVLGHCLTVEGTRVTPGGGRAPISSPVCSVLSPVFPMISSKRRPLLALHEARVDGSTEIVGHYDPWASGLAPAHGPTMMLVHFASEAWEDESRAISEALAENAKDSAVAAVVVRREEKRKNRSRYEGRGDRSFRGDVPLMLTDDVERRWAEAMDVKSAPSTLLVGPEGRVVWRHEGDVVPKELSKAVGEHTTKGGRISWQYLRLAVGQHDPATDFPVRLVGGRGIPLRRFRGNPVALVFWTSRSEPSLEYLRRLSEASKGRVGPAPIIFAIGDGEDDDRVAELAGREGFSFRLVPDPDRRISRRYGVSCWPTTVRLGPDLRVEAVDFGILRFG